MEGTRLAGILVTCGLLAFAGSAGGGQPFPEEVAWHTDLDEAYAASRMSNRPMLIVFESGSCVHCWRLRAETLAHPQVVYYVGHRFVPVRLTIDEAPHTARVLGVSSLPTSIVLSPEADLLGRIVGSVDPRRYVGLLESSRRLYARLQQAGRDTAPPRSR